MGGRHPFIERLSDDPAVLRRAAMHLPAPPSGLNRYYERLNPGQVDLGFAGRQHEDGPVHRTIAGLNPGDPLELEQDAAKWTLVDTDGTAVGRLAGSYKVPPGMKCISARIAAVLVYKRQDSRTEYATSLRCDKWEVVVPELVFAPGG
jgi:ATP-dependent DNA helicase RecQ